MELSRAAATCGWWDVSLELSRAAAEGSWWDVAFVGVLFDFALLDAGFSDLGALILDDGFWYMTCVNWSLCGCSQSICYWLLEWRCTRGLG